jgi:GntR family transcriptional regulator
MFFNIDPSNGLAIYEQVVRQVVFAVAAGSLKSGDMVPSVRELARELAINPNTVARAYRQLQDDGVLQGLRGTGLAVTDGAGGHCEAQRRALVRDRVQQVLLEAKQSRLDHAELRELVDSELTALTQIELRQIESDQSEVKHVAGD